MHSNHPLIDLLASHILDTTLSSDGRPTRDRSGGITTLRQRMSKGFDIPVMRSREKALEHKLIRLNLKCIRWFILDLDHRDSLERCRNFAAQPNVVVQNPANGHAHAFWLLATPYWLPTDKWSAEHPGRLPQANWTAECIKAGLVHVLGADQQFNGILVKNPRHPAWETFVLHDRPWNFADLIPAVDMSIHPKRRSASFTKPFKITGELDRRYQRNTATFHAVRKWAYRAKSAHSDFKSFQDSVAARIDVVSDSFHTPLARYDKKSLTKSVATWVWTRWTGFDKKNRGVLAGRIDPSFDLRTKQCMGARYVAVIRYDRTLEHLRRTFDDLIRHGKRITQVILAEAAKVCVRTVAEYWVEITGRAGRFINRHVVRPIQKIVAAAKSICSSRTGAGRDSLKYTELHVGKAKPQKVIAVDLETLFEDARMRSEAEKARLDDQKIAEREAKRVRMRQPTKQKQKMTVFCNEPEGQQWVSIGRESYKLPIWWTQGMIWSHHRTGRTY